MTDIEQKALALLNEVRLERGFAPVVFLYGGVYLEEALMRAIEQLEAFRQEVSDAVEEAIDRGFYAQALQSLIIPAPKPDPLVELLAEVASDYLNDVSNEKYTNAIRAALDAAGFEIREKNDG